VPSLLLISLVGFAAGVVYLQTLAALPARGAMATLLIPALLGGALWACRHGKRSAPAPSRGAFDSDGLASAKQDVALAALRILGLLFAGVALGIAYAALRADIRLADALPNAWEGESIRVVGVIDDLPQNTPQGTHFAFAVERVLTAGATVPARVSIGWYTERAPNAEVPVVHAGERWMFSVRLRRPHGTINPSGFDLEAWLLEHNLRATGYVRGDADPKRVDVFVGRPDDYVQRARERIRERILAALPDAPYAGVLVALAIGDQRAIPETQWLTFNRTGVSHLISISGLHVTAFATLAGALIYRVARRGARLTNRLPARKVAVAGGALFALAYVLLAGAEVPALRTLAMLWVGACGLWLGRPGTAAAVWLWSLIAVLLLDPWASLAPGFWLSFGAVGLLLYAGSGRLTHAPAKGLRKRLRASFAEGARAQWVVTIGLVPGTLALFQQVSLVSVIANAIAIPAVTLGVVPLALFGIAVPLEAPWQVAHAALALLMRFLEILAALPSATWASHAPPPWTVLTGMIGVLWLIAPRGVPGRAWGVIWLVPLCLVLPPPPATGAVRITVLDVGQGLAVVLQTAHHAIVYDTGPRYTPGIDAGGRIVVPFLRAAGIRRLDALIVSHHDLDHSGGALSVLAAVPTATLLSSIKDDDPIMQRARELGTAVHCVAGQTWQFDDVVFTVLHPPASQYDESGLKPNNMSCVLRIDTLAASALLTGDIEARDEAMLLRMHEGWLKTDVLVVPHHGSRTSSTLRFVVATAPGIAIFANGYRNRFGHPRPDVVERYRARGAQLLRSDFDGAVTVELGEPSGLRMSSARAAQRRYWHDAPRPEGE
jgi:competence protein ComEC